MARMGPRRRDGNPPRVVLEFIDNYQLYPDSLFYDPFGHTRLEENLARFSPPQFMVGPPRPIGMLDELSLEVSGFFGVGRIGFLP